MLTYVNCSQHIPQHEEKESKISKIVVPFATSILLAIGTGAEVTNHSIEVLAHQYHDARFIIQSPILNKIDTRSPAEYVSLIRKAFALNTSELASVLKVTRPTVYAWLDGQEPILEKLNHIKQLSRIADELQALNISRIDTLVHRVIFDGRSLLDKLKANEDILKFLPILKKLADKEEQARREPKGSNKNLRSFSETASAYSSTLYKKS